MLYEPEEPSAEFKQLLDRVYPWYLDKIRKGEIEPSAFEYVLLPEVKDAYDERTQ